MYKKDLGHSGRTGDPSEEIGLRNDAKSTMMVTGKTGHSLQTGSEASERGGDLLL